MFSSFNFFKLLPFLFVAFLFFLPPIDTDLGWHLRYGNYFLETGKVLRENTLSYFLSDYNWSHSYTFYQILTALIYKWGNLLGLSFAYSALGLVLFKSFVKVNPQLPRVGFLFFLGACFLGWSTLHLGWRAQIFTILGVVLTIYIWKISKEKEDPRLLFLLPAIFVLWANLHGGFILGLAILSFASVSEAICGNWREFFLILFCTIFSTIAVLLNPFGVGVYQEAIHHIFYPLKYLIAEWVPLPPLFQGVIGVMGLLILFLIFLSQNRRHFFWVFCVGLFAYLAFTARRNLPLFGIVSFLGLIDILKDRLYEIENHPGFVPVLLGGLILGFIYLLFPLWQTIVVDTDFAKYCSEGLVRYPCQEIEYIKMHPLDGQNVYSAFEWGGFLEWQLPQYKYFVDGRMPAWLTHSGESPYTTYLKILQARPGYQEWLDTYGTDWLLIGKGTFLDLELQKGENKIWQEAYRGDGAVIYQRRE